jgi:uncharacterized membrane protein
LDDHAFIRSAAGAFVSVDVPGGLATYAYGINDAGAIVGCFFDTSWVEHGFLRNPDATFTVIDVAGSVETCAIGIDNTGTIVGTVKDEVPGGAPRWYSFIRNAVAGYTVFTFPSSDSTWAYGNDSGVVVGYACTPAPVVGSGACYGYRRTPQGVYTIINAPGAVYSIPRDVNGDNEMVGDYLTAGSSGGFVQKGFMRDRLGVYRTIAVGSIWTVATGLNDNGDVVGSADGRGFLIPD